MIETEKKEREKAFLVGLDTGEDSFFEESMQELADLVEACDREPVGMVTQVLSQENKATCIGSGKVEEIGKIVRDEEIDVVVFDNTLSPIQMRNLQDVFGCVVLDRTGLILEIFARRARTREAMLQVECANLKYMLPRLVGMRKNLGRQGGTSGALSNKGAGEKKIELDRRSIEHRLSILRKELKEVEKENENQRKRRDKSGMQRVAIVGYTNAGKSTIMNQMVESHGANDDKKVFEKDMLFATLETSVRRIGQKDARDFFLSDTVGFIHKLPHDLVEAFQSTLKEATLADLILHVVDISDPFYKEHIKISEKTLNEIGAGHVPVLYVYNKMDKMDCEIAKDKRVNEENAIYISAKDQADIERLCAKINATLSKGLHQVTFLFPFSEGGKMHTLQECANVRRTEYLAEGILVEAEADETVVSKFEKFLWTSSGECDMM